MTDTERMAALVRYVRPDDPTDADTLAELSALADTADDYLGGAGVYRTETTKARYDLCLHRMVLAWYDDRNEGEGGETGTPAAPPVGLRQLINQLKTDALC